MTLVHGLTVLAAVSSGMLAGIYTIFSIAIVPALNDLRPDSGIRAMQRINVRIMNPAFLLLFMGAPVVSIVAAVLAILGDASSARVLLIAGAALVTAGSFLITMGANVPRNNVLDAFEIEDAAIGDGSAEAIWARYAAEWTRWNHLRALLCVAATLCLSAALI